MSAIVSTGNPRAVLDACVLVPAALRDTLLRLAERPSQYIPQWSEQIWQEVIRTLESKSKIGINSKQSEHLYSQIKRYFPECFVTGFEELIPLMDNEEKDRHVLAAAVACGASVIVTFNLKDFPPSSLKKRGIEAQHPDDFLISQYELNSPVVINKLRVQAANIGRTLPELLRTLEKGAPHFTRIVAQTLRLKVDD
jgi:predicted nucleic acid-binding protein